MGKTKKVVVTVVVVAAIVVCGCMAWFKFYKEPHDKAVSDYNNAVTVLTDKNKELDEHIDSLNALIKGKDKPYSKKVAEKAAEVVKEADSAKRTVPKDMPSKTKDIVSATGKIDVGVDYSEQISELDESAKEYSDSIKQLKQVTNPKESFVIERLKTIKEVKEIKAVTEDNDPNGHLNKPHGYTATVYFVSSSVDQSEVYYEGKGEPVDKGTDGGGAVEVYANVADAKKRNSYLEGFDGPGITDSGSHRVVGTCVIRTSEYLTASKQRKLERKVINALIALD